jgi:hypothetical protein
MARKMMQEAIDKEDFEREELGLEPRRAQAPQRVDPPIPEVEGRISVDDAEWMKVETLEAHRSTVRDSKGCLFVGFDVSVRIQGGKSRNGWIPEGELIRGRRLLPSTVSQENIQY